MFTIDAQLDERDLNEDEWLFQLKRVSELSNETVPAVGVLTSLPRSEWFKAREKLVEGVLMRF